MNRGLFQKTSVEVKIALRTIRAPFQALMNSSEPDTWDKSPIQKNRSLSGGGYGLTRGPQHNLTSGHSPVFFLFSYFGERH